MRVAPRPLVAAGVIAPALMMTLAVIAVFAAETVPWLVHMSRADTVEQHLFGFTSFWGSFRKELLRLLWSILVGPAVSVPFGFIGATLYLGMAFAAASTWGSKKVYVIFGGLAGACHAAIGIAFSFTPDQWLPLQFVIGTLPYATRALPAWCAAASAPLAGLVAGYVYAGQVQDADDEVDSLNGEAAPR